jgi:hypothetical protein
LKQVAFCIALVAFLGIRKGQNIFAVPAFISKHLFLDIVQVAFGADQMAENEFAWPCDTLNYRILEHAQIVFRANQGQT